MDWHQFIPLPDGAEHQYVTGVQISTMKVSRHYHDYIVPTISSFGWAILMFIHLRQFVQVRGTFTMYRYKWLLVAMMCLMFGVNAYLIVHVAMHRDTCSPYTSYHDASNTVTGSPVENYRISRMRSIVAHSSPSLGRNNCSWPDNKQNHMRKEFCNQYYWYMDICRCRTPINFSMTPPNLTPNNILNVPVAVIASNRTQCLSRTLYNLMLADGANASMINVFLDGNFKEQIDVCKLYGVNVTIHDLPHSRDTKNSFRITEHYRISLTEMFDYYPTANSIIILEDDLQVSPDFFSFFSQTAYLLDEDDSLYCMNIQSDTCR